MPSIFKKWFFVIPLCALVVFCSVFAFAPSAEAVGADGTTTRYAVLPFDVIRSVPLGVNPPRFSAEWCYNVGMAESDLTGWRYDIYSPDLLSTTPVMTGSVLYSNSRISGSFRIASTSNFALETAFLVFEMDDNNQALLSWDEETVGNATISISFDVVDFTLGDDNLRWETDPVPCNYSFTPNGLSCDLYGTIYDMLVYNGFDDDQYYGISELQVVVYGSTITSVFNYEVDTESSAPNMQFYSWFDSQALPYVTPNDLSAFALGEWLGDVVQAFMDFEIYPGLSLNRVFAVVLVIGVFFMILTLVL